MSKPRPNRPVPTFDHLTKKKPVELRDWIALDQQAASDLADANDTLERAKLLHADDPKAPALLEAQATYDTAREAAMDSAVEVVFRALSQPKYKALKREFPPTEAQNDETQRRYGMQADVNADEFAPHLIAASCVQPVMTVDQVRSLPEEFGWSDAEMTHLYQLALRTNESRTVLNLDFS